MQRKRWDAFFSELAKTCPDGAPLQIIRTALWISAEDGDSVKLFTGMAPRPFPFQLGVGIDICRITRIVALLRQESTRNRWARRVFTRLEWMALCWRFERVNQLQAGEPVEQKIVNYQQSNQESQDAPEGIKIPEKDLWMLPKLSNLSSILEDTEAYSVAIGDARSPLGSLARHLAGRLDSLSILRLISRFSFV